MYECMYSAFQSPGLRIPEQKFAGFRYLDSLTWSEIEDALALCNRNPARMILKYPSKSQSGGCYPSFVPWNLNKKWIR